MDFEFSPEQQMMQQTVRALLREKYNTARIKATAEAGGQADGVWQHLADAGIFALQVPEAEGGMGLGFTDLALILEEFGRALVPATAVDTLLASDLIARFGTPAQQARWLGSIAEGRLRVALALAEPDAGYALEFTETAANANGEGWVVEGGKILVPGAAGCDLILASVRFTPGGVVGLVGLEPSRAGINCRSHAGLDRSVQHDEVTFSAVKIQPGDVLGGVPLPASAERAFELGAAAAALQLTGIAAHVLDTAVDYAGQRTQFGKPIGSFQAIKHRCADMAVSLESARSAAYYSAWAVAESDAAMGLAVSMAKSYCNDMSRFIGREGIQIHGGIGFTWELGLHWWIRRAKLLESAYGDATWHRERVLTQTMAQLRIEV